VGSDAESREASSQIGLAELIDHRPMSRVQVRVALLCAAILFVDGYDIQVMALAVPSLAAGWSVPASNFGLALSAVVIGISLGSGLLGPLGDDWVDAPCSSSPWRPSASLLASRHWRRRRGSSWCGVS